MVKERILERESEREDITELRLYGMGGIDESGEWRWNGHYYRQFYRGHEGAKYNYLVKVYRICGKSGRVKRWDYEIYMCVFYTNSEDIVVEKGSTRTLKEAKNRILEKLNEWNRDEKKVERALDEFLKGREYPVFYYDKETGIMEWIGTAYRNVSEDMKDVLHKRRERLWYNKKIPDYERYRECYYVCWDIWKEKVVVRHCWEEYGSYANEVVVDEEIKKKCIEELEKLEGYEWLKGR